MTREKTSNADTGIALKLKVTLTADVALGSGKADLLEGIAETGSIAAAGRRMGMSYKRAWTLVESLNTVFAQPLVTRTRGGAHGGGARLTAMGRTVLALYRDLAAKASDASADERRHLTELLKPGRKAED